MRVKKHGSWSTIPHVSWHTKVSAVRVKLSAFLMMSSDHRGAIYLMKQRPVVLGGTCNVVETSNVIL